MFINIQKQKKCKKQKTKQKAGKLGFAAHKLNYCVYFKYNVNKLGQHRTGQFRVPLLQSY